MGLLDRHRGYRDAYASIRAAGADPFAMRFDEMRSPTVGRLDGRDVIILGANNYLGLTFDPDCVESSVEAVRRWGTGTTGSRIANGSLGGHDAMETALARFFGRRHAMLFTTGYQANLGVLSALVGRGDHLILDADSHASIYDGARLGSAEVTRFRHNDPEDLYKRLRRLEGLPGERLIVVEGIYSMLGDKAPLREIAAVKRELGGSLLVDEAHSMGVLGARGRGLVEEVAAEADVDFIVGTLSKSLGAIGGFCVSDAEDFDLLRVVSRPYMFTASLPPAVVGSTLTALEKVERDTALRARLNANAMHLYDGLRALGFETGPEPTPIVAAPMPDLPTALAMWNGLLQAGVYLNLALPPATPDSRPLLRSSVSAVHTPAQIDAALHAFEAVGSGLGVIGRPPQRAHA